MKRRKRRQHPRGLRGLAPWAWVLDSGVTGSRDQEEGLQVLLGKWKASGKRASSKMILETITLKKFIFFSNFWLHEAPPPAFPRNPRGRLGFPGPTQGEG